MKNKRYCDKLNTAERRGIIKDYLLNLSLRQKVFLIMSAIIILIIYSNSMQVGEVSSNASGKVKTFLNDIKFFDSNIYLFLKSIFENTIYAEFSDIREVIVRKMAHITEFCILSFCISQTIFNSIGKINIKQILLILNIGFIVAFIDETIQLFVGGRSGMIQDVIVDFIGIIFGCVFVIIINTVINKVKK